MGDVLVDLGQNRRARSIIKTLGLPVPMPERLARSSGPFVERPLEGRTIVLDGNGTLLRPIGATLVRAGANVAGPLDDDLAEAWGRPAVPEPERAHGLILDASGVSSVEDLKELYTFFHPRLKRLARNGRVVVIGRPGGADARTAAARGALDGFVRSVAKEVGRKGATANLITVAPGAESALEGTLRWLLSPRSAFITGQPFHLTETSAPVGVRPLEGRRILVTGAARGIGEATARRLAEEGAKVFCLDRPADDRPLSQVAQLIGGTPVLVDVTAPDAAEAIAAAVGGPLHGVVHNAGVTRDKTLAKMSEALWDLTLAVNLEAILNLHAGLPLTDDARVVLLSSIAGLAGNVGQTNYAASKAAVAQLARHLGTTGPHAVNAVAPGFIETRLTDAIPVATREVARRLAALSQGGAPLDVAELITFLCTPASGGLTGQVIRVCGGNFVGA